MKKVIHFLLLGVILVLATWLRFYHLHLPTDMYFDEIYHVPTADLIAKLDPRAFEWWHQELTTEYGSGTYVDWLHPPLAKLLQAASIKVFGLNSWSWRFPAACAGVALVVAVYLLSREFWGQSSWAPLIAAFLAAIDGVAIAMSRVAMNDIFLTLWCTLAVYFFWRWWRFNRERDWWAWAFFFGCALASKWSGVFLGPLFATWLLIGNRTSLACPRHPRQKFWNLVLGSAIAGVIYLLAYDPLFFHHDGLHFWQLHEQILRYQLGLKSTHPFGSPAWMWPWGFRPVLWYSDDSLGLEVWERPFYCSWYLSLGCLFTSFWLFITKKLGRDLPAYLFLLLAYLWLWAPWLFSPRVMFLHHYLPALPFLWAISGRILEKICPQNDRM